MISTIHFIIFFYSQRLIKINLSRPQNWDSRWILPEKKKKYKKLIHGQ